MKCINNFSLCLPEHPPYHPNCRCHYPEFIIPDDDGGEEIREKRYFIIIYRRKKEGYDD